MPPRPGTTEAEGRELVVAEVSVPLQRQGRPAVRHSTRPELVDKVVELALTGRGSLIVGDAGVGKTHLVNLVVPQLTKTGARVVTVTATAAPRAMPTGALEPLLGAAELHRAGEARAAGGLFEQLEPRCK